jgi:hypothetical protein
MTTELVATAFPSTKRFAGPVHRSIVAVDLEGSTTRIDSVKGPLRRAIYDLLGRALEDSAITDDHLERITDRGDGALLLIRPHDDVPKTVLLDQLIPRLASLLAEYNAKVPEPALRIRLRAVVHAGEVYADSRGFYGEAIDIAIRLLDSSPVKKALKATVSPLVLVVSEEIHASIVAHGCVDICTYQPLVRVRVAARRHRGWVHIPGRATLASAVDSRDALPSRARTPFAVVRNSAPDETLYTREEMPIVLRMGEPAQRYIRSHMQHVPSLARDAITGKLRTKSTADVSRIDRADHTESSPVKDGQR